LEKHTLRRRALERRSALAPEERERLSRLIREKLERLEEYGKAKTVAFFYPVKGEPDLLPLLKKALKEKRVLLPKVEGEEIKLYRVGRLEELKRGAFGIPEPEGGEEVPPEEVELFLVPGLLFDGEGYRLGFGRGYYDRLLGRSGGLKVGVAYEFQVVDRLPRERWDAPVDLLVTERRIRRFTHGRT